MPTAWADYASGLSAPAALLTPRVLPDEPVGSGLHRTVSDSKPSDGILSDMVVGLWRITCILPVVSKEMARRRNCGELNPGRDSSEAQSLLALAKGVENDIEDRAMSVSAEITPEEASRWSSSANCDGVAFTNDRVATARLRSEKWLAFFPETPSKFPHGAMRISYSSDPHRQFRIRWLQKTTSRKHNPAADSLRTLMMNWGPESLRSMLKTTFNPLTGGSLLGLRSWLGVFST
jgi:hypothetical protein